MQGVQVAVIQVTDEYAVESDVVAEAVKLVGCLARLTKFDNTLSL